MVCQGNREPYQQRLDDLSITWIKTAECAVTNGDKLNIRLFLHMDIRSTTKKETQMKNLKLFMVIVILTGLSGCISIGSKGSQGPQGPQGPSGTSEKVIVVPEKQY
jgi:hypothetical protein